MQLFKRWMEKPKWEELNWEEYGQMMAPESTEASGCDCDCQCGAENISPKQLAALALIQTGMVGDLEDPRVDGFWELFYRSMSDCGYIIAREANEYYW